MPRKVSDNPAIQARYEQLLAQGVSDKLAEMFAFRQPPGTRYTEKAFLQGRKMDPEDPVDRQVLEIARRAGISTQGKIYVGGLADQRGPADPAAWVSTASDVIAVAKRRGRKVEGALHYDPGPAVEKEPKPTIAPDLMKQLVKQYRQKREYRKMKLSELKKVIIENHAPKF